MTRSGESAFLPERVQAAASKNDSDTAGLASQLPEIFGQGIINKTLIASNDVGQHSNNGPKGKFVPLHPKADNTYQYQPKLQGHLEMTELPGQQANKECEPLDMNALLNNCKEDEVIQSGYYKLNLRETNELNGIPNSRHTDYPYGETGCIEVAKNTQDGVIFQESIETGSFVRATGEFINRHMIPKAGIVGCLETDKENNVRYFVGKRFHSDVTDEQERHDGVGRRYTKGSVKFWLPLHNEYPASARPTQTKAMEARMFQSCMADMAEDALYHKAIGAPMSKSCMADFPRHDDRENMLPPPSMRKKHK